MSKPEATVVQQHSAVRSWPSQLALIALGSLLIGLCAHASAPLPFSPVPLTLSNFGVLLVGLLLGSRAGFAAALLYLLEGSAGLPVFSSASLGLFGPTGGYLMAYPFVAFLSGYVSERFRKNFVGNVIACLAAEILLFASGIAWLMLMFHVSFGKAANWGVYPFLVVELAKMAAASGIATRVRARAS